MTVPAFSLPAVPPGPPPSPAGTGVAALSGNGGLFEGLLAGAIQAEQGGWSTAGAAPDDQTPVEVASKDETSPPADAGMLFLMFAPTAAPPAASVPPPPSDMVETEAPPATGPGGLTNAAVAPAPVANDILGAVSLGTTAIVDTAASEGIRALVGNGRLDDLAGLVAKAGEPNAPAAPAIAPVAPVAPPSVTFATEALQSATVPPAVVAPAVPMPATTEDTEAVEAAAVAPPPPSSTKAASTEGDSRRTPGAARAARRDGASRADAASTSAFAPKSDLLATTGATSARPATGEADAGSDTAPDPAVLDSVEAPETRQPSLIAETRAQATQATAAAIDAAAVRGSPETVAKMAADIVRKLDGQSTRFDLQLDPHGMGKVDVAIEIDRAGKLTAAMSFDSAQSAADLRGRAGELRLALEQAGFDIAEGGLSFDLSDHGAGFSGREAGQQERAWNGRAFLRAQSGADEADLSLAATPSTPSRWTRSGVDIRI